MNVLDIFSGIGGFSLGLERCGFKTVAFCEVDKKARLVLEKRWPGVPIYGDIKELTYERLKADNIPAIDVICGGFPCQDISLAGKGAGIEGKRSGLWSEFFRLTGEVRPRYVLIENVAALRYKGKGLYRVLGDMASLRYSAEWHCIPACALGAPHQRDRIWIIAYPQGQQDRGIQQPRFFPHAGTGGEAMADTPRELSYGSGQAWRGRTEFTDSGENVPHADGSGRQGGTGQGPRRRW